MILKVLPNKIGVATDIQTSKHVFLITIVGLREYKKNTRIERKLKLYYFTLRLFWKFLPPIYIHISNFITCK